ncbi:23S rRNA (uracil(1939)-C(5))-methyltransferase RlmD [uncultured Ferrimonas sp.]|uniref:23S rRNA (uracil(1939)-C(5))-methyltransferase RlmD n=1 Tax=uncultured Ferrimonas sp. TaxID=432640 RepID=UPI00262931C8|nr:23S rRNA (uracil(1939)-C(5))-methyltransferase RlmD [uncultured Ferrimonas sp.]
MAQFFSPKSNKKKPLAPAVTIQTDSLDHQGQAVAHHQGKVIFIDGLLPGEQAKVQLKKDKSRFATATVVKRLSSAEQRVKPSCRHFEHCGGCQLQYASGEGQRQFKQQALEKLMQHHLGLDTLPMAAAISSDAWHYRRRARLGAQFHQGQLQLGFRQSLSNKLVAIEQCPVLAQPLEQLIAPLGRCIGPMGLAKQLGHIDLLLADEGPVVLLRVLRSPNDKERQRLRQLAQQQPCLLLLDDGQQMVDLEGKPPVPLHYQTGPELPSVAFLPGDFFQVNDAVNQRMIAQALQWLAPQVDETGLDLFCGGGNFSLPLATLSKRVIGVEGIDTMTARATARAAQLGLDNVEFHSADLNGDVSDASWAQEAVDWVLLDPARAGAGGALKWLPKLAPKRLLYVSCSPLTLAQDAKVLAQQGYSLSRLSLVDMFPHTGHLESMALFERRAK